MHLRCHNIYTYIYVRWGIFCMHSVFIDAAAKNKKNWNSTNVLLLQISIFKNKKIESQNTYCNLCIWLQLSFVIWRWSFRQWVLWLASLSFFQQLYVFSFFLIFISSYLLYALCCKVVLVFFSSSFSNSFSAICAVSERIEYLW